MNPQQIEIISRFWQDALKDPVFRADSIFEFLLLKNWKDPVEDSERLDDFCSVLREILRQGRGARLWVDNDPCPELREALQAAGFDVGFSVMGWGTATEVDGEGVIITEAGLKTRIETVEQLRDYLTLAKPG